MSYIKEWNSNKVLANTKQRVEQTIVTVLILIESHAKSICPVKTGTLRRSITHEYSWQGNVFTGRVGTNVYYAFFVFCGTRYMAARPTLIPALERGKVYLKQGLGLK